MACSPSYSPVALMAPIRSPSDKVADGQLHQHWFEPNLSIEVQNEQSEVKCIVELSRARALDIFIIGRKSCSHGSTNNTMHTEVRHTRRAQHVQRVPCCRYGAGRVGINMLLPVCYIQSSNMMASEGHNSRKTSMASTNFDKIISLMVSTKSTDSCMHSLGHNLVSETSLVPIKLAVVQQQEHTQNCDLNC